MRISGFVKNSLVDYPGHLSAVVFTQGCNMNCSFCHNRCLIGQEAKQPTHSAEGILSFLKKRQGLLDAVVISGGEPTIQPNLVSFIREIRALGFRIKLDTNGTNPSVLKELIDSTLIDYVAMDVKAPLEKYEQICCSKVDLDAIQSSIHLLMQSKIDYEFRTTFAPALNAYDLMAITEMVRGAKKYVVQQYREVDSSTEALTGKVEKRNLFSDMWDTVEHNVMLLQTRGEFSFMRI